MPGRDGASHSHISIWGRVNPRKPARETLGQLLPFPLGCWDPCSRVFLLSWKQQLRTQTFWEPDPHLAAHSAVATRHWAGGLRRPAAGRLGDQDTKKRLAKQRMEALETEGFRPGAGQGDPSGRRLTCTTR